MQVHEKQILSALLMLCLCVSNGYLKKFYFSAHLIAVASMFHLVKYDFINLQAAVLQLLTILAGYKHIPKAIMIWVMFVLYGT